MSKIKFVSGSISEKIRAIDSTSIDIDGVEVIFLTNAMTTEINIDKTPYAYVNTKTGYTERSKYYNKAGQIRKETVDKAVDKLISDNKAL